MKPEDFPLPGHAYLPGINKRHAEGFLDHIIDLLPREVCDETADTNIPWNYGLRLIDEGFFWEAHEVLEAVWMAAQPNSREKHLVQGMIHLANAKLKKKLEKETASLRLITLAEESLKRAFQGLSNGKLMELSFDELQQQLGESEH